MFRGLRYPRALALAAWIKLWVLQEKRKGQDLLLGSTDLMGWGFNQNSYRTSVAVNETIPWSSSIANNLIRNDQLLTEPFFRKPGVGQLGHLLFEPTVDAAEVKGVRDELLALALPSLTLVTGGWLGETMEEYKAVKPDNAFNMNDPSNKNGWPSNRENTNWLHSDIKDVSYVFDQNVFESIVNNGGLK